MDLTGDAIRLSSEPENRDSDPEAAYRECLAELAAQSANARFRVAPNPCVGAAVFSNGVEVGRGFHEGWGGPHAEVAALTAAADSVVDPSAWDTLLVTLEPCSSQGKTPPCVEAIIAAGLRRVVMGELDPDPRHRGRGIELLQAAGIEVAHLPGASSLAKVSPYFLRWTSPERVRRPRPWMIAKWAQTRTGQLSPPRGVGDGTWITGPEARAHVQRLRAGVEAIITGVGTILADDPRLTVRPPALCATPPLRVILDSHLSTPPTAKVFRPSSAEEAGGAVHLFTQAGGDGPRYRALEAAGATIHSVHPGDDGRLSLREISSELWRLGVQRAILEAGPRLIESWMKAELVDQVRVYTADMNGGEGPTLAHLLRPKQLESVSHGEVGSDSILEGFLGL